jgi:hypothetical protein
MPDRPPSPGEISEDVTVIVVDYEPGTPDPSRVFRAMAGLIDASYGIDRHLAHAVAATIQPQVVLERVEAGSIRAYIRTLLLQVDDEALRTLDWKPLIGQYLVKGKHIFLKWLDGKPRIGSLAEVEDVQRQLQAVAPPMMADRLLPAAPIPVSDLLADVEAISKAVVQLQSGDTAELVSTYDRTRIETRLVITKDEIESLLTESVSSTNNELTLLIKKPDYLGNSMWEFLLNGRTIEAKMQDENWLGRFRHGEFPLHPGDALRAVVRTEVARGFEGQDVATRYFVLKVLGIVPVQQERQSDLL